MTEQQFTPEYIEFMRGDEAKVLQQVWKPRWGDFVHGGGMVHVRYKDDLEGTHYATESGGLAYLGYFCWLPTLYDLLRIIEEVEWEWRKTAEHLIGYPRAHPSKVEFCDDKDLMLAAAKLAVRALTERRVDA